MERRTEYLRIAVDCAQEDFGNVNYEIALCLQLVRTKALEEAAAMLEEILRKVPPEFRDRFEMLLIYCKGGELNAAVRHFAE